MGSSDWRVENVSPIFPIRHSLFATRCSRRLGGQLLALFDRLFDGADHVEGLLGQVVVLAFATSADAREGGGGVDALARRAGEDFSDEERLRQEALDLARACDSDLV